ncbi:uncharacterized protein HMPREF1541_05906 [Cyphellophora europaea CBS 101466]|uniref:F-box domain-containing protein n=1 Tax=Cyphellophora europaea (strain CBS 101466) TaxID=1220924 RepID=W2RTM9_CYPE1|nr:uncharacterized protein HMPREF1541_05906 [Cyphellophora europaea CBS 101466]ETN39680.1 hypothetical protein HMPREF1541_05906 [Cyphellophora europaea CBS 101466]
MTQAIMTGTSTDDRLGDPFAPNVGSSRATMPAEVMAQHMKQQDYTTADVDRKRPLQLLDLNEDILQAILREVTHTNDLTALALTHSTLHDLVIPHIYSRFDIVWPEANTHIESRVGVDALTYGLATLVMASDVFGEAPYQQRPPRARQNGGGPKNIRRGNHFAQYTKKFSLGNGPADWVSEYLITKEGGKMLGTLVALAVGRMRNLEAFIWDMPTGVLRDVWLALASLGNRDDGNNCRLEKVWVRWHENATEGSPLASPPPTGQGVAGATTNIPAILYGTANALFQIPPYPRVEFPTFSILPPLKSLTVLDIDEKPYVEEMAVLVENSLHKLRELRIGLADHAQYDAWTMPLEDRSIIPAPLIPLDGNSQQQGGIMGILVHRFCDPTQPSRAESSTSINTLGLSKPMVDITETPVPTNIKSASEEHENNEIGQLSRLMSDHSLADLSLTETPSLYISKQRRNADQQPPAFGTTLAADVHPTVSRRMQLDTLELERIYLSVPSLSRGIDWTHLKSITLLGCRNHESLWKELRRKFTPPNRTRTPSSTSRAVSGGLSSIFSPRNLTPLSKESIPAEEYRLNIKKIHTDTVSPSLIQFIKNALAPDSLEWLFLQENTTYKSSVSIDAIYRGAIRRHRGSLRKLLIDSGSRKDEEPGPASWRRWVLNRELLGYITSGKMRLRELCMSIDYKDWHYFLQRLPQLSSLRSLHINHIADHVHGTFDSREAALQVLDIVSLRPDLEICYLGIQRQCFEVLEYNAAQRSAGPHPLTVVNADHELDSDDNDETVEEIDDDNDFDVEISQGEETEDESQDRAGKMAFKLREILFYDDKVSIFRARHGRL